MAMAPSERNDRPPDRTWLREQLAELEHRQWMEWSQHLAAAEGLSADRLARWRARWVPYAQLPEAIKDQDRVYADRILALLGGFIGPDHVAPEPEPK
jgi:hypothetical protein